MLLILECDTVIFLIHSLFINAINHVQCNFTKQFRGLHNTCYLDKLHACNLASIELWRVHNGIIFIYKILNGFTYVNIGNDSHTVQSAQMFKRDYNFKSVIKLNNISQNNYLKLTVICNRYQLTN